MTNSTNGSMEQGDNNAIILAAGLATRCRPLSEICPKGLFFVKGEPLIERQIRQIKESGINEVIIVVGHLADRFEYLVDKYNVKLIFNSEYSTSNNMSSVWCAKDYIDNSYICGSDNWFNINVFKKESTESYFSSFYTSEYVDEYCIEEDKDGFIVDIKKGGSDCRYTLGEIYMNHDLSKIFIQYLEKEYGSAKNLIIDEFCIRHLDDFRFKSIHRTVNDIFEFDTIDEFCAFDDTFLMNNKQVYRG